MGGTKIERNTTTDETATEATGTKNASAIIEILPLDVPEANAILGIPRTGIKTGIRQTPRPQVSLRFNSPLFPLFKQPKSSFDTTQVANQIHTQFQNSILVVVSRLHRLQTVNAAEPRAKSKMARPRPVTPRPGVARTPWTQKTTRTRR